MALRRAPPGRMTTVQAMSHTADLGFIGLAVMGRNLVMNMADHGFTVAVYNRTQERTNEFLSTEASGASVVGTRSIEDLVSSLDRPRIVMLMIKAGPVSYTHLTLPT